MNLNDEELRAKYRADGWGRIAEAQGLDPIDVETAARDQMKLLFRAFTLLAATQKVVQTMDDSPILLDFNEQEVDYDGTTCDGHCLHNDIKTFLDAGPVCLSMIEFHD